MQTIRLTSAKVWGAIFLILAAFTGCKKDPVLDPAPPPAAPALKVLFSNASVSMTDIDSVVVIVRDQNQFIKKWRTMAKAGSSFNLGLHDVAAGNYTAEILAYSKKRSDFTARQYAFSTEIILPLANEVVLAAPTGSFNDAWYQRAVFFETSGQAVITVAMDPRDTYYGVIFKEAKAKKIILQRSAVYVNFLVASKTTTRSVEGMIGFTEYSDFIPYQENMKNKNWTKGYITGWIERAEGDIAFDYEYDND